MIKKEYTCDIVFLDHKMHDLDGVETVKVLRELEGYSLPKIISLAANASFNTHDYYKSVGFDDYIAKPVNIKDLDKIIKKYCRK